MCNKIRPERCVIFCASPEFYLTEMRPDDYVIACDGGYAHAVESGVRPDLVVGDFDSYDGRLDPTLKIVRVPCEKDDTDTMLAIKIALEDGYRDFMLLGATGGRLDHLYANLQAAAFAVANGGCRVTIHDSETMLYFLTEGSITLPRREGWSLSVFAVSDTCEDVCITGGKYALNHAVVTNTFPIGMSNQWAAEEAKISVGKGILMVMSARM